MPKCCNLFEISPLSSKSVDAVKMVTWDLRPGLKSANKFWEYILYSVFSFLCCCVGYHISLLLEISEKFPWFSISISGEQSEFVFERKHDLEALSLWDIECWVVRGDSVGWCMDMYCCLLVGSVRCWGSIVTQHCTVGMFGRAHGVLCEDVPECYLWCLESLQLPSQCLTVMPRDLLPRRPRTRVKDTCPGHVSLTSVCQYRRP